MAITFTNQRFLATGDAVHMGYNQLIWSQMFKLRVDSQSVPDWPGGTINVLSRNIFDFEHSFWGASGPGAALLNLQLNGINGSAQLNFPVTLGSVYVICLRWDGVEGKQVCYVNSVAHSLPGGPILGPTTSRSDPIKIGPTDDQSALVITIGDVCGWDGYAINQDDASYLTDNGDPTTIGTGAAWRSRWTLDGTPGQNATGGDAGLLNAYGSGADLISVSGTGTAVYAEPLIWAPTVTAHPYVAGCGSMIGATFTGNFDGALQIPSQLLNVPTLKVNGVDHGALTIPWGGHSTGAHQCMLFSTPGTPPLQISPADVVELTAPSSWANTPAGSVAALSGAIDNRAGRSSVGVETLTKTLRLGFNHPAPGGLEYYPFNNAKFKIFNPAGFANKLNPGHGYEIVNQPCEAGRIRLIWDATLPLTPAIMSCQSNNPDRVTITHIAEDDISPVDGVGYVRVYEVAYVGGSDYQTAVGGSGIGLNYDDPAFSGTPNYDDLCVQLPGEWDTSAPATFDRSDRFAPSLLYMDRVAGMGSGRGVDMTACGGEAGSFPFPELLTDASYEFFWGYNPVQLPNVGFTSIGPVDPVATPWIYSAQFRDVASQFHATLSDTISTTPAVGTHETWHFSDGATAPLLATLEVKVDDEIVRLISGAGTDWLVYRGSNGTTPATHSPGTVTVFGRQPIRMLVDADGVAPFTAPSFVTCNGPHGLSTLHGYFPQGVFPPITLADDSTDINFALANCYVTGPDTFMSIWSGIYMSKPAGTKPSTTYTLDPTVNYMFRLYFPRMPVEVYCNLISRSPHADLHINVPKDACDDMIYRYAWLARDNFPAGRKIYVEWANEPWNFAYPFQAWSYCTFFGPLALPAALDTLGDPLPYHPYRAARVHEIFREVFTAAGRGDEIKGIVNVQMASGSSQVTPHLNLALALGQPFDAVACAPYFRMGAYPASVAAFNLYDDDQAAEMLLHDITWDASGNITPWLKDNAAAVRAYNVANGKACALMCYEGGVEFAAPDGATRHDERSHDIQYNPHFYDVEQGWAAIVQASGAVAAHIYGLGIGWPYSWGVYHMRTQQHSRGDGLNGAADNRVHCINPDSPGYAGGSVIRQDIFSDSVRGRAVKDWNNSLGPAPPPPVLVTARRFALSWFGRWFGT